MSNIAQEDNRFVVRREDVDPNFSPERNKEIIEQTIRDYEAMRKKKIEERAEEYAERSDAVTTYLKSLEKGGNTSDIQKYFGKRMLAYLRGQEIRDQLMAGLTVKREDGVITHQGV